MTRSVAPSLSSAYQGNCKPLYSWTTNDRVEADDASRRTDRLGDFGPVEPVPVCAFSPAYVGYIGTNITAVPPGLAARNVRIAKTLGFPSHKGR